MIARDSPFNIELAASQEWAYPSWPSIVYFRVDVGLSRQFEAEGGETIVITRRRGKYEVVASAARLMNLLSPPPVQTVSFTILFKLTTSPWTNAPLDGRV